MFSRVRLFRFFRVSVYKRTSLLQGGLRRIQVSWVSSKGVQSSLEGWEVVSGVEAYLSVSIIFFIKVWQINRMGNVFERHAEAYEGSLHFQYKVLDRGSPLVFSRHVP